MTHNKLFAVVKDEKDPEGKTLTVEPTEYMAQLEPEEAIAQLKMYVQTLADNLEQRAKKDLATNESVEEIKELMFELEVAQLYLGRVFESWKAAQKADTKKPGH